MIEQPQSDAKHQPNQLVLSIPNKTPVVVDQIPYCFEHLH